MNPRAPIHSVIAALAVVIGVQAGELPSFFDEEVARFTRLARSSAPELRLEAAQGFRLLKHHVGEAALLPLARDRDPGDLVYQSRPYRTYSTIVRD